MTSTAHTRRAINWGVAAFLLAAALLVAPRFALAAAPEIPVDPADRHVRARGPVAVRAVPPRPRHGEPAGPHLQPRQPSHGLVRRVPLAGCRTRTAAPRRSRWRSASPATASSTVRRASWRRQSARSATRSPSTCAPSRTIEGLGREAARRGVEEAGRQRLHDVSQRAQGLRRVPREAEPRAAQDAQHLREHPLRSTQAALGEDLSRGAHDDGAVQLLPSRISTRSRPAA